MSNKLCICGGGSLGHAIAGFVSVQGQFNDVNILTSMPHRWSNNLRVVMPDEQEVIGELGIISDRPEDVIPQSNIILLCLPGFAIRSTLKKISRHIKSGTFVGCVFASTGFFFEAMQLLPHDVKLFGFQRVPFIARTLEYGSAVRILGLKNELKVAVERANEDEKNVLKEIISKSLNLPIVLLNSYLEASLTNSNPLLHTSRLYSMFHDWNRNVTYNRCPLFYEDWTLEASELYKAMDDELFNLIKILPVNQRFLTPALEYYESHNTQQLKDKIQSIEGFKGIKTPMIELNNEEWVPDFNSRYFTEDFAFGLKYIWQLAHEKDVRTPHIDMVYEWGMKVIAHYSSSKDQ